MSPNRLKPGGSSQTRRRQPTNHESSSLVDVRSPLYLKQSHVTFKAPTQKESVFFDECNREIISLTCGPEPQTRVIFQSTDRPDKAEFSLPVGKRILSIKLNPSRTVLAYHVEKSNIEFINVEPNLEDSQQQRRYVLETRRYIQSSRMKNSKLLGFLWTGAMDLVMITDISIEYYHVDASRHRLSHVKSFQSSTNWFVYQPSVCLDSGDVDSTEAECYSILMVSTGSLGNSLQPYMFNRNQIIKLQRFEVEGNWHGSDKLELFERSVTIASIYGSVRLLVLQHESLNVKSRGAQILLYTVDQESGITAKTHTLDLDVSGKFAINILDNLVIVHDQPSKSSFIFDIMIDSTEKSDCAKHFVALIDSQPIRPLRLEIQGGYIEMYSLNWVFFQPNFIIDAKMGLLSHLHLDLVAIEDSIQDNLMLLNLLAHRTRSEQIIVNKCREIVAHSYQIATGTPEAQGTPLVDVSSAFEILSRLVISAPVLDKRTEKTTLTKTAAGEKTGFKCNAFLSQEDIQRGIFQQLETAKEGPAHLNFVTSTLLEFIFFVRTQGKNVEFCIYKQLLMIIVNSKRFYQLVQMIRSEILEDSKQLACHLLSLRGQYPPAAQLGLDMLQRLDCLTSLFESLNLSPNPAMLHSETTRQLSMALRQSLNVDTH